MRKRTLRHLIFYSLVALWVFPSIITASQISINRIDSALSGQRKTLTVSADSIISKISGFDITIAHEGRQAAVYDINPGNLFDSCGWEYFAYRQISADTVFTFFPQYPVNLINIVGLASLSGNPSTSCNRMSATLAEIDLQLSIQYQGDLDDRFVWYRFFWRDCNDNVLTSVSGDTLFIANKLFQDFFPADTLRELELPFPGFGIPDEPCSGPGGEEVLSTVNFVNSGILFTPIFSDSINPPIGDINLNGIRFELADAILLIEYFKYGLIIFTILPPSQLEQADIDGDGIISVRDVVLLIRIAIGDYWFYDKPATTNFGGQLVIDKSGHEREVSFQSDNEISALYLRLFPKDGQQLSPADFQFEQPDVMTGQIGDTITMLLADLEDNIVLSSGTHGIFQYFGDVEFNLKGSVVDVFGREVVLKLEEVIVRPESPLLHQNYPNPFNPSTTIEFNLPGKTDWKLEIYNVNGQNIKSFSGNGVGSQTVNWNGTNSSGQTLSSGVYFYKLMAAETSSGRKMLLLK